MPSDGRFKGFDFPKVNLFLLATIALVLVCGALKVTAPVVLPFVIALLLTFVLEPVVLLLEKLHVPKVIGAVLVILALAVGVYVVGLILFNSLKTILTLYPKYEDRFTEIYRRIAELFELPYDSQRSLFDNLWGQLDLRMRVQQAALRFSESFIGFLTNTIMVILFVVFLLLELGHFRDRLELAFAGKVSDRIAAVVGNIVAKVARYLSVKFFISLTTGILVGILLALLRMDFPIVWGVVSFILNFIPNIGSIAAGAGVTLFALVQFWPEPGPIFGALAIMLGVNQVLGNLVEPKVQGYNLGLSPFVILASLLAWGWLWGFAGLILAVPMTVIIKIICENVPVLEPVSIIMGSYKAARRKDLVPARGTPGSVGKSPAGAPTAGATIEPPAP